jgi:hypothetical protein
MRVITFAQLDIESGKWEVIQSFTYNGPVEMCDRAAQNAAKTAEKTAASVAGEAGGAAAGERAALTPFYRQEMQAQHLYQPQQMQELLSAAGTPLAASAATTAGQAASQGARTRNTSGYSAALDQAARERNQAMGQAGLDIGAQDIMGAKKLNQQGAAGMAGLFGQDQEAMLKAMGIQTGDINAEVEAGKSGWLQNLNAALGKGGMFGEGGALALR